MCLCEGHLFHGSPIKTIGFDHSSSCAPRAHSAPQLADVLQLRFNASHGMSHSISPSRPYASHFSTATTCSDRHLISLRTRDFKRISGNREGETIPRCHRAIRTNPLRLPVRPTTRCWLQRVVEQEAVRKIRNKKWSKEEGRVASSLHTQQDVTGSYRIWASSYPGKITSATSGTTTLSRS